MRAFFQTIQQRQGLKIACPEEIAYHLGYINADDLERLAQPVLKSGYGQYLLSLRHETHWSMDEAMKVEETALSGVVVLAAEVYRDSRGAFLESWNLQK